MANIYFAPQSYGGATIVAEQMATHLRGRGHEVIAFTGTMDPAVHPGQFYRYEAEGLPVLAMGRTQARTPAQEYYQPDLADRFRMALEAVQPDVVHFHSIQNLGVEIVEVAQAAGVPTVVTLHDAWWLCERQFMVRADGNWCRQSAIDARVCATCVPDPEAHFRRQQRSLQILNDCRRVLTPSRYWHDLMLGSGISGEVLQVNRNGVRHPREGYRRSPHQGPVRFAFIGGEAKIKGAPQVREALAGMTRSDYELILVDQEVKLGQRGLWEQNWQHSGLIRIVPGYDHRDIDDFFDGVDVLLFPSQWHESYGLTVREAILRGTWVIATEGGGAAEDLAEGVNASLIPLDGRGDQLGIAMEKILDEPGRFKGAATPVQPIPTFTQQAIELEEIYSALLPGR